MCSRFARCTGSPSLPPVAQVFNLCAFPIRLGIGAAHAHRRTLTTAFQAFARSMLPSLRHRGFVRPATPALGHGQPLAASSVVAQVVNLCHGPSVRGGSGLHRSLVAQVVNLCHGAAQVENLRYRPHPSHRFSTWVCSRFGLGSQHHPSQVIHEGRAAGSGARAEDGDMCGHWAWVFRTSSELAHAAGFEHVTGRLRIRNDSRGSGVTRVRRQQPRRRHRGRRRGFAPAGVRCRCQARAAGPRSRPPRSP